MYNSHPRAFKRLLHSGLALALLATATQARALDDPMRPPRTPAATPARAVERAPLFNLTSTLIAEGRRIAVINGRQLQVGDTINGARLEAIMPTRVKLRMAGTSHYLDLIPLTVKKPSKSKRP